MNERSVNTRMAFYVLVVAILIALASLTVLKPQAPDNVAGLCPPAEEIQYIRVTASGEGSGSSVTRAKEEIDTFIALASSAALKDERHSYIGIDYTGTLYTVEMGHANGTYAVSIATDGSVFHANGKFLLAEEAGSAALYAFLEGLSAQ